MGELAKVADLVIPVLVSGLESLLKTERHPAIRQFVVRAPMLADALGVTGVDRALSDSMYDARSAWVHGAPVELFRGARTAGRRPTSSARSWRMSPASKTRFGRASELASKTRRVAGSSPTTMRSETAGGCRASREVENGQLMPKPRRIPPDQQHCVLGERTAVRCPVAFVSCCNVACG